MITLFQFPRVWNIPNASLFCMKLETYLRMANIPYEIKIQVDTRKGPKHKMPYIKDGDMIMGDSGLIIDYLKKTYGDPLDQDLTTYQKSLALAFQRLVEEHFYWIVVYSRWCDDNYWPAVKETFFANVKGLKGFFLSKIIRKKISQQIYAVGIGRHTLDEIYQMGCDDISAISHALGEQKYFLGVNPSSIDACIYAAMANILECPLETPLKTHAKAFKNLVDYCARMKNAYYGSDKTDVMPDLSTEPKQEHRED